MRLPGGLGTQAPGGVDVITDADLPLLDLVPEPVPGGQLRSTGLPLTAILVLAAVLRFWHLAATGFNSDESVYTGSASSLAGDGTLHSMFPVFRAHPLLFQVLLSLVLRIHETDFAARAFAALVSITLAPALMTLFIRGKIRHEHGGEL